MKGMGQFLGQFLVPGGNSQLLGVVIGALGEELGFLGAV